MKNLDEAAAVAIANGYLKNLEIDIGIPLLLTRIQEELFGWVFYYQSKDYVISGNPSSQLAGNAPFIVKKDSSQIHILGTAYPVDVYIKTMDE